MNILITGASDGIGRALVDQYPDANIIAMGRRAAQDVSPAFPSNVSYIASNLTNYDESILATVPDRLDLAILNAGIGKVASPQDHSPRDIADMIALNVTTPLLMAQSLLPRIEAAGGTLVFIGSTATAHKSFSVYTSTKAALRGAARSLAIEWAGRVNVLTINPGPTATAMHDKAGLGDLAARRLFTHAQQVARDIAKAIAREKSRNFGAGYMLRHALLQQVLR